MVRQQQYHEKGVNLFFIGITKWGTSLMSDVVVDESIEPLIVVAVR
jgi:hypothetical protein